MGTVCKASVIHVLLHWYVCLQCADCTGLVTPTTHMPPTDMHITDDMRTTAAPAASSSTAASSSIAAIVFAGMCSVFVISLFQINACCIAVAMKHTESNYDKMFDKEMDMYERVAALVYTMFNDYFLFHYS